MAISQNEGKEGNGSFSPKQKRYKKRRGRTSRQEEIELSMKQILLRLESKRHQGIVSKALESKLEGHVKDISCVLHT